MNRKQFGTAASVAVSCLVLVVAGGCSAAPRADVPLGATVEASPGQSADTAAGHDDDVTPTPVQRAEETPLARPTTPASDDAAVADQSSSVVTEASTMQLADQVAEQAAPAPAPAVRPAASPAPAVRPSPSPVASTKAATVAPPVEVVAVSLTDDNRIAEVDPLAGKMMRMVDFNWPAGGMATAPDGHSAWVFKPRATGATIGVFDLRSGDRHQDIRFHESDRPVAVAFSSSGSRAYVAIDGSIVYATAAGKEFGRVSVGRQSPGVQVTRHISTVAVGPGSSGDTVFAGGQSNGLVWALDGDTGAILKEINVGGGPLEIVVDPVRQRAYVLLDTLNQLLAIDTTTYEITSRLQLPAPPLDAALTSDGTLFVNGGTSTGEIWVVSPNATELRTRIPIEGRPVAVAASLDGKSLYVADAANNQLDIVSADTVQVMRTVSLPSVPVRLVVSRPAQAGSDQKASPEPTPVLAPTPTPLPQDAPAPDRLPTGAIAEPFVAGANAPVALAFAPDGRLFYNELRTGKIRIVKDGVLLPAPFYQFIVDEKADGGLVGLTLDPDFATNHYVYAMYTTPKTPGDGGAASGNQVVRLTDVNDRGIELKRILQDLPTAAGDGALRFGADGKLYASVADDQKGGHAQDLKSLAGKILRVNADGSTPTDNPFVGQAGNQELVWAFGLRGAQSLAVHPVGHQLMAAVSAQGDRDALELVERGGNYGWPGSADKPAKDVVAPLAAIKPSIRPTGSTFYVGDQLADWKNDWFYCTAEKGELRRVRLADQSFDRVAFEEIVRHGCTSDVASGPDGALYYSDAHGIYRIRVPDADALPAVKVSTP
jgi:glucose/arabinose dehydrogenase